MLTTVTDGGALGRTAWFDRVNGPLVRSAAAPIDYGGRQAARHRTPAGETFASVSESQGDRASLSIEDDAVGRDGHHRNSPLDELADPEQLLPRTGPVLQDRESRWIGQDDPAKPPFLSDELAARRRRPAPWRLRTDLWRREHDGDCENKHSG